MKKIIIFAQEWEKRMGKKDIHLATKEIIRLILGAKEKAYLKTSIKLVPELTRKLDWPIQCLAGQGLEDAIIACKSEMSYFNRAAMRFSDHYEARCHNRNEQQGGPYE